MSFFSAFPLCRVSGEKKMNEAKYDTKVHIKISIYDFIIFSGFLLSATYVLIRSYPPSYAAQFNKLILNSFTKKLVRTDLSRSITFKKVIDIDSFYEYMEAIFLESYHKDLRHYRDFNYEADSLYLPPVWNPFGAPRIRQLRVTDKTCIKPVSKQFEYYFYNCYGIFRPESESFEPMWRETPLAHDAYTEPIHGIITNYYSTGYAYNLTLDYTTNVELLQAMRVKQWLDEGTRLVVIEMSMFTAHEDLIGQLKLIFELPKLGAIMTSYQLTSFQVFSKFYDYDKTLQASFIVSLIFLLYSVFEEVVGIFDEGLCYFRRAWNYIDWTIIISGFITIWCLRKRLAESKTVLNNYINNRNAVMSLDLLVHYEEKFRSLCCIVVFCLWLKLFKFFGFNRPMQYFRATLRHCAFELFLFTFMYCIVVIAFAQLGYMLFGGFVYEFRSFNIAILSMIKISMSPFHSLGNAEIRYILNISPLNGYIFYSLYIVLMYFILLNMFIAIMVNSYNILRDGSILFEESNLVTFCMNLCRKKAKKVNFEQRVKEHKDMEICFTEEFLETNNQTNEINLDITLEKLQLRIKKNEELLAKLCRGLDDLVIKLMRYRQT